MTELYNVTSARTPTCPPATSAWAPGRSATCSASTSAFATSFDGRAHRQGPDLRRLPGPHRGHRLRPAATSPTRCSSDTGTTASTARPWSSPAPATWPSTPAEKATAAGRQGGRHVRLQRLDLRSRTASIWTLVKEIKEVKRGRIKRVRGLRVPAPSITRAARASGASPATSPCPAPPRTSCTLDDAKTADRRTACIAVAEGANMPSTPEAIAGLPGRPACSSPPPRRPTPAAWPPPPWR